MRSFDFKVLHLFIFLQIYEANENPCFIFFFEEKVFLQKQFSLTLFSQLIT